MSTSNIVVHNNWKLPHVWTNAFYIIVGLVCLFGGAFVAGLGLCFLGVASWLGHLKGGKYWILDWVGMYIAFFGVIAQHTNPWLFALSPLVAYLTWTFHKESFYRIGTVWLVSVFVSMLNGVWILPSLILFTIGFILRQIGETRDYNELHGAWHFFTALGILSLVYNYILQTL